MTAEKLKCLQWMSDELLPDFTEKKANADLPSSFFLSAVKNTE